MPISCIYWQVILRDFVKILPETKIFTSRWIKDPRELENELDIEVVGKLKVFKLGQKYGGYGSKFAYMSLKIVGRLLNYRPQLIFADTFCFWTLLILLTKPLGRWKVILAYEGSSPGVDYRNSFLRLLIRKAMIKMADASITNTQAGKTYLVELGANQERVYAHPYFVPDVKFLQPPNPVNRSIKRLEKQSRQKQPACLFIGRLIPRKDIQSLLEACVIIKDRGYESYSLTIVGEGEQRSQLETFCQQNNLSQISWEGQIDYELVADYLHRADILILPSIEDTWGMVVIEAILAGKGIFCSQGAGASEIIAKAKNGYVFEPQDRKKLASLMQLAIDDPKSVLQMSQKSQEIASQYIPTVATEFLAKVAKTVVEQ